MQKAHPKFTHEEKLTRILQARVTLDLTPTSTQMEASFAKAPKANLTTENSRQAAEVQATLANRLELDLSRTMAVAQSTWFRKLTSATRRTSSTPAYVYQATGERTGLTHV